MSAQTISDFPTVTAISNNDVFIGNRSLVTSLFPFSTITQTICAAFLTSNSFVFVPSGATAGQVIAYNGTNWATSSTVEKLIIGGSSVPRSTLDVLGGIRTKQGAPTSGNNSNIGYAFEGDGDTGMFSVPPPGGDSNGSISFFLNQTEAMKLASGGNVGIGITSPLDKLHVDGGIIASQIKTNDPAAIFEIIAGTTKATGKAGITVKGIGEIELSTGSTTPAIRMKIASSGATTFYGSINGTSAQFSGSVTAPTINGSQGNFSTSVTAPNFYGNVTGNLTGNVYGGTISGTTGTFSTSVAVGAANAAGHKLYVANGTTRLEPNSNGVFNFFYDTQAKGPSLQMSGLSSSYIDLASRLTDTGNGQMGDYTLRIGSFFDSPTSYGNQIVSNGWPLNITTGNGFGSQNIRMSFLSGGYTGVNTTTPTDVLHVAGVGGTFSTGKRPSGWDGGITTWDLYAGGTIGTGSPTGNLSAWINGSGDGWFEKNVTIKGTLSANIGIFKTSIAAPTFVGSLVGGTVTGTTANFTTSVSAPILNGNLQGTTATLTKSVSAPALSGSFFGAFSGDGSNLKNLKFPYAVIKTVSTFPATNIYSLISEDANVILVLNNSTKNITVAINTEGNYNVPIGTQLVVIQTGTGSVTFTPVAGVILTSSANARKIFGQHSAAVLLKIGSNSWFLGGDIKN